jgi:hypothetical protein
MGDWASKAEAHFKDSASKGRQDEELEVLRHHKTVAGAESLWDQLVSYMEREVKDFNRRMEREFLVVHKGQNEIGIDAPKIRLTVELDRRTPSIDFKYNEPYPNTEERDSGEYHFRLNNGDVLLVGQYDKDTPLSIETVGGELLDPLVA